MAMAQLFYESGYDYALIHCNFKLRGSDSDLDEAFVKKTALRYGTEIYCRSFNTTEIAKKSGASIQMVARDLRYDYFAEVAEQHKFDYIAIAHHLDDQTETFFINLIRGCGIAGLHGIREKHGNIIRPMMFAHRKEIEKYVSSSNIPYREDASNKSMKYKRNKLRNQIMPLLIEMNPAFDKEMARNINRLAETEEIFRQYIGLKKDDVIETDGNVAYIDIKKLKDLHPVRTFLFEFISEYGYKDDDVMGIIKALENEPGKKFYSASHQLILDRKKIIISEIPAKDRLDEEFIIDQETRKLSVPISLSISIHNNNEYKIPFEKQIASLDMHKLDFPLRLRHWKEGDTFIPLGMSNRKKLSDFFIDEKFSLLQKEQAWVLCSGDDIIWIVGERINDRYKITEDTREVYKITIL